MIHSKLPFAAVNQFPDYDLTKQSRILLSDGDLVMGPIPGEAGTDYPVYNTVPDTGFDCAAQDNPGIYTDTEAGCQVRDMNILKIGLN